MVAGADGHLTEGPSSDWTDTITLTADCGDGVDVHFNRGFVLSQFMSSYMARNGLTLATLKERVAEVGDRVDREARAFLGGTLRDAMLAMLASVRDDPGLELHAALYELGDAELVGALGAVGPRAHVVLANGSVDTAGEDQNADAREALRQAGVAVFDRFLAPKGLAHNKFVVIGRRTATGFHAERVWTGSTNWTPTGLCTQLNNGIMITNETLAAHFDKQFELLKNAGSGFPKILINANNQPALGIPLGTATVDGWFSKVGRQIDIAELIRLVRGARDGILYVMFQPGNEPVQTILSMQKEKALFVRGVATQFSGAGKESLKLLKDDPKTYFLESVEATGIGASIGRWAAEGTASQFRQNVGHAITHSKLLVIDPFGDDPVVVTGSHNFSKAASSKNDENFLVIRGHRTIARHYAVNAMQTYNHYRWRAYLQESRQEGRNPFQHLSRDPDWQSERKSEETRRMLDFWLR